MTLDRKIAWDLLDAQEGTGPVQLLDDDEPARLLGRTKRIAMVGAGSVLGEGAFFSHLPRSATVNAGGHSRLWCLTPLRFRELSTRFPVIALELTVAMAAVLARRMYNKPKRVAVT